MRRHLLVLPGLALLVASPAVADDAVRPEDARGWEQPPDDGDSVVRTIGRGIGHGAGFLVDAVTWPIRAAVHLEDRYQTFSRARDAFYNADHTAGIVPTTSIVSGFGARIGVRAFHDDLFGHHERVALRATYGGSDRHATEATLELPALLGEHAYASLRGRYETTDNMLFAGIGNPGDGMLAPDGETRYGETRWLGTARAGVQHVTPEARVQLGGSYIYNDRTFDADVDASLAERYDPAALVGFTTGVRVHEVSGEVAAELHDRAAGRGVRATGFAGRGFGPDLDGFTHWGGEVSAYVTPWRAGRVLLVRVAHEGVAADGALPFTELPRLGGSNVLRGYHRDRFRDDLAAVATLEYRYPIHRVVAGSLFVEAGKVAATYDALATRADWHAGYGGGFVLHSNGDPIFTLQLAYGDALQVVATTDVLQAFRDRGGEL